MIENVRKSNIIQTLKWIVPNERGCIWTIIIYTYFLIKKTHIKINKKNWWEIDDGYQEKENNNKEWETVEK